MQFISRTPLRRATKVGLLVITIVILGSFTNMAYAGQLGWVYERNELRASYGDKTWWYVGDGVTFYAYIANMHEWKDMESGYADVFLISPSGTRINVTRIQFGINPLRSEQMHSFTVNWDSTGAEPGNYRLELEGEGNYQSGETKALSNFMDDAVKLFDPAYPALNPHIKSVNLPKTQYFQGEPFTWAVTIQNQGNVATFPHLFTSYTGANVSALNHHTFDQPGLLLEPDGIYEYRFNSWIPSDLPPGTYTVNLNLRSWSAWISADGFGYFPWPPESEAYRGVGPRRDGPVYIPYPTEDPATGFPIANPDGSVTHLPCQTTTDIPALDGPGDCNYTPTSDIDNVRSNDGVSLSSPEGAGSFGWGYYLYQDGWGPATLHTFPCGEITVVSSDATCEIDDYAFTALPLTAGSGNTVIIDVFNDGDLPLEPEIYYIIVDSSSGTEYVFEAETQPDVCFPGESVLMAQADLEGLPPGDYEFQLQMQSHSPWPTDMPDWACSNFHGMFAVPPTFELPCPVDLTGTPIWDNPVIGDTSLWPTYGESNTPPTEVPAPPVFDFHVESFFDVFNDVDIPPILTEDTAESFFDIFLEVDIPPVITEGTADSFFDAYLVIPTEVDDYPTDSFYDHQSDLWQYPEDSDTAVWNKRSAEFAVESFFDIAQIPLLPPVSIVTTGPVITPVEPAPPSPEEPPEGPPVFSDWLIGDAVTVTATVYNIGELPIVMELGTVFGTMPTGATFVIGRFDSAESIAPGDSLDFPFVWSSEGAPAGTYTMSLGGAVSFSDGSGQMLYNFEPNAWVLVDPNPPMIETEIQDLTPLWFNYLEGAMQMDTEIVVQNTGASQILEVQYEAKLFDADGNEVATDSGSVGTSGPSLAGPGEETSFTTSFVSDGFAPGDYSLQVTVTTTDEHGDQVTNDVYSEDYFHVDPLNPDFLILDPTPLWFSYLEGAYQVDAEIEIQNTGNSQVQKIEYEAKLFDADWNEVATDSGTVDTSGPSLAGPGETTSFTTSFVSDGFAAGDYSLQVTVTTTDEFGNQVTNDLSAEDYFSVDPLNPGFDFTEVSPGQDTYTLGPDPQMDAIILLGNTGNVPLYSFNYVVELLDADGNVVATDSGTRETSSGPLVEPGEVDQVTASFFTDELAAGDYSVRVSVTGVDADGTTVTNEMFVEDMFHVEALNPDFLILDPTPLWYHYLEGAYQVDAEIEIQNTGNSQVQKIEYEAKLFDADGNEVATDSGSVETSGPSLAGPGEKTSFTTSFVSDGFAAGDYSVQVTVTTTDEFGNQVTNDLSAEDYFSVDPLNPDFDFTEVSPGQDSYVDGEDLQVDAIILLENTGNVPLYSFNYKVNLLDSGGNVVATDTGTRETSSGPLVEPGEGDQVTASFLTDNLPAGVYSTQITVTGLDADGNPVINEMFVEDMIKIEASNRDFDITEVSPGQDSYVDGEDLQVDAIVLLQNTGNVPLYSFDYKVELLDSDGNVVATDMGTRETSSGPLVEPGEVDQVTGSFLTDDLAAGDYSVRVSVTGVDSEGGTVTNDMFVEDMIKIAENPDTVVADSEDEQTTTGIPGFPLGSIVAGLAIVILLQYLNHSRRD